MPINWATVDCVVIEGLSVLGRSAGSTINQDAPAEKLTLARERQRTLENWKKPTRKTASQPEEDAAKG